MANAGSNRLLVLADSSSIHTQRVVNGLCKKGWEILLLSWRPPSHRSLFNPGVRLITLPIPPRGPLRVLFAIVGLALQHLFSVQLVNSHFVSTYGLAAAKIHQLSPNCPLVTSTWGSDVLRLDPRIAPLVTEALRNSCIVTADGGEVERKLLELGAQPNQMRLVSFGVDTTLFDSRPPRKDLKPSNWLHSDPIVVSLRTLSVGYDVGTLVRAAPKILQVIPSAKFLIVGDGPERVNLEREVTKRSLAAHFWFPGRVDHDFLPDYLNLATLYVSTSLSDSGPAISTLEAMSVGMPAVVTNLPDNLSFVEETGTCSLFRSGDAEDLASKVIDLLQMSPERRIQISATNRALVRREFDWERCLDRWDQLLREARGGEHGRY